MFIITMGIVVVAFFAANANGIPVTTIRSTLMEPGPPQAQKVAHSFARQTGIRW